MNKFFSLALSGLASAQMPGSTRTINGDLYTQTGLYLRAYAPLILSEFLGGDSAVVDQVLGHGCFCAKLDSNNPYAEHLGGTQTLDELDEICRDWFRTRNCNDRLEGGSCKHENKVNKMKYNQNFYKVYIDQLDDTKTHCLTTDPDSGEAYMQCAVDDCTIDLYFAQSIKDFLLDNPSFTANVVDDPAGSCIKHPENNAIRTCHGTAPHLEIQKSFPEIVQNPDDSEK